MKVYKDLLDPILFWAKIFWWYNTFSDCTETVESKSRFGWPVIKRSEKDKREKLFIIIKSNRRLMVRRISEELTIIIWKIKLRYQSHYFLYWKSSNIFRTTHWKWNSGLKVNKQSSFTSLLWILMTISCLKKSKPISMVTMWELLRTSKWL